MRNPTITYQSSRPRGIDEPTGTCYLCSNQAEVVTLRMWSDADEAERIVSCAGHRHAVTMHDTDSSSLRAVGLA